MDEKDLRIIREIRKITRKNPETENYFIFKKYFFIEKEKEFRINAYIDFYLEELEKINVEITEMFYVRTYLERYILYKIYRECESLTEECRNYFKKRTPTELTEEQLYISAELFPSKYSFIVKVVSEYNG